MIKRLPQNMCEYITRFDLTAIALTRDGRLISTRDPVGAEAAWWAEAGKAGAVMSGWPTATIVMLSVLRTGCVSRSTSMPSCSPR